MGNGRSELEAALMGVRPSVGDVTEEERGFVGVNNGGALQEGDGSERDIVCRAPDTTLHHHLPTLYASACAWR